MKNTVKIQSETEKWESGELGRDAKFVRQSTEEVANKVDDALNLQPITVRLQKELIEQLKIIATARGIGYQPMVRMILPQYVQENSSDLKKQRA